MWDTRTRSCDARPRAGDKKGDVRALSPFELTARYLGGLRMLKRKPSATRWNGSAGMLPQHEDSGSVSPGAMAHRFMETSTPGIGDSGGAEPSEQFGP